VIARGLRAIPTVGQALDDGLGTGWRDVVGDMRTAQLHPRFRVAALQGPFFSIRNEAVIDGIAAFAAWVRAK
jgi:hypothetical protein